MEQQTDKIPAIKQLIGKFSGMAPEPAAAPVASPELTEAHLLAKAHVEAYTRSDGVTVAAHDTKVQAAQEKPAASGDKPAAGANASDIAEKHSDKMRRKATAWDHEGEDGKIPHKEVAHLPEFSHKEVYGNDHESSPNKDYSPHFDYKKNKGFVLKHPNGKRSFVDTQGSNYARYHAPVGNVERAVTPAVKNKNLDYQSALRHPDHQMVVAAASRQEIDLNHAAEKHALDRDVEGSMGVHGSAAKKLLGSMTQEDVAAVSRGEIDLGHEAEKAALGKPPSLPKAGKNNSVPKPTGMFAHAEHLKSVPTTSKADQYKFRLAHAAMAAGDKETLKHHIATADTYQREEILDHIHPDHWEELGSSAVNKAKSVEKHERRFGKPIGGSGAFAPKTVKSENEDHGFHGEAVTAYLKSVYGDNYDPSAVHSAHQGRAKAAASKKFSDVANHLVKAGRFDKHEHAAQYLDSKDGRHLHDAMGHGSAASDASNVPWMAKSAAAFKKTNLY